jgi:hypothetical protein
MLRKEQTQRSCRHVALLGDYSYLGLMLGGEGLPGPVDVGGGRCGALLRTLASPSAPSAILTHEQCELLDNGLRLRGRARIDMVFRS